ncbi:hypothetical protein SLS53_003083 [Cytospora paraplurivora]|uniref:F-box domain-containing protein n=1 Tax=Cytospora paraplurivora TaxID=2898453 RepID=A0AAN9UED5_9PEZI
MAQITDLPPEVLGKIFTEHGLECRDLARVARVCTAFSSEATRANLLHNIEYECSSILIVAAQQGRIDLAQKALSMGANVNTIGPGSGKVLEELQVVIISLNDITLCRRPDDDPHHSLIHSAAASGLDKLVRRAIDMGTNPSAMSMGEATALHFTSRSWNSEAVIQTLVSAGVDPDGRDMMGRKPLHRAYQLGNFSTALQLLKAGATPLNVQTGSNYDIQRAATCTWHPHEVAGGPETLDDWHKEQAAFLHTLMEDNGLNIHQGLIDTKSLPDNLGRIFSFITRLCPHPLNPEIVAVFLEKGVDPNRRLPGYLDTPLGLAIDRIKPKEDIDRKYAGNIRRMVYLLVEHGARVCLVSEYNLRRVKQWVEDEAVHKDDRDLSRYLLRTLDLEGGSAPDHDSSDDDSGADDLGYKDADDVGSDDEGSDADDSEDDDFKDELSGSEV